MDGVGGLVASVTINRTGGLIDELWVKAMCKRSASIVSDKFEAESEKERERGGERVKALQS